METQIQNRPETAAWDLKVLRYELNQLRREREHLASKSNERPLTSWETSRIEGIADEITELVKKVVNLQLDLRPNRISG